MSSLNPKTTLQFLLQKGFIESPGDHKFLEFWYNGKFVLHTKISRGSSKDLGDGLISQMAHQCKLPKNQFMSFAKCDITQDQYEAILLKNGILN